MNYQPKAGRCRACTKLWEDCSALPFHTMPVHSQDGTDAVVICSEFVKASNVMPLESPVTAPRRIYLSGPMTGLPEFNYPAFHAEAARLRALGYHVENPAENPPQDSWEAYMEICIPQMRTCDTIALLPGWSESRGALRERQEAVRLGMTIIPAARILVALNGRHRHTARQIRDVGDPANSNLYPAVYPWPDNTAEPQQLLESWSLPRGTIIFSRLFSSLAQHLFSTHSTRHVDTLANPGAAALAGGWQVHKS